jgi:hypothetical protein
MTTVLQRPDPADLLAPEGRRAVLAVAVVAGAALGIVDLLLQRALPYPWANLANSSAMWALVAFAYGAWVRRPGPRVAAGGAVLLVVAVVSYHVAAAAALGDDVANAWSPVALAWCSFGVVAGMVFGLAGSWARSERWQGVVAAAVAGAVCFAEFALVLVQVDDAGGRDAADLVWTAVITAVIGIAALVASTRTAAVLGRALLLSVPLAAAAYLGFSLAGFAGGLG